jgi:hypothetical protein
MLRRSFLATIPDRQVNKAMPIATTPTMRIPIVSQKMEAGEVVIESAMGML